MGRSGQQKWMLLTIVVFGAIYSLISLVNHYLFRTYALDLGAYNNALYDYAHFRWNYGLVFKANADNLLADHFDLYRVIFSPVIYLFGTYTLLIVQILAVLLGGMGIYRYFRIAFDSETLPLIAMIHFYLFFGIFSAVSFDYHSNVVAAMLLPWFFYFFRKGHFARSALLLFLMLISKENISFWMVFVCGGLILEYRKDRRRSAYLLTFSVLSLIYFITVTQFLMPAISRTGTYLHFHYSVLGSDMKEAIVFLLSHPIESIRLLFVNHSGNPAGDFVKAETHLFVFFSGLVFLFFRPSFLIMLIPVYFQKMFNDNYLIWSIDAQYSIEYAPVLTLGAFTFIGSLSRRKRKLFFGLLAVAGSLAVTIRLMDNTVIYTNKAKIRFYKSEHYQREYDVAAVHEQIRAIPKDAAVSAQSPFLPHLSLRDKVYQFPSIRDAQYIVLSEREEPYPLDSAGFGRVAGSLVSSGRWEMVYSRDGFIILRSSKDP